jgi:hypothetical protein
MKFAASIRISAEVPASEAADDQAMIPRQSHAKREVLSYRA